MESYHTEAFIKKMTERLGAAECMTFSGRTESLTALFEAFQLGARDCVYVSALAPCRVIKAIIACGAVPMLCDVSPDSLTIDHRALEAAVRQTIAGEQLYPRAVIADNFCGMPFALKPVKSVCDRMGLVFIEDCGECFGGTSDGIPCGSAGDYSLVSLGKSSVFGTGGSGAMVFSFGESPLCDGIVFCDGDEYQPIDDIYGEKLNQAFDRIDDVLTESRAAALTIDDALSDSDFWIQRGGNSRQKSAFGKLAIIAQSDEHCARAVDFLTGAGLAPYVKPLHVHRRACFDKGCRGFKTIENAAALAPRAFCVDIFGALHAGALDRLTAGIVGMAKEIRE